jgi:hypothetical protein
VITGRGPGAPGMTPGLDFTRRRADEGAPGTVAADLGEIRRAEEAIELLAVRAAAPPGLRDDPAVALLTALAADVDTPGAEVAPDPRVRALRRRARGWEPASPARGLAAWLRTAVAGAVVAGLAGTTSLIAASMLARLTGGRARPRARGWAGRHARPRRFR